MTVLTGRGGHALICPPMPLCFSEEHRIFWGVDEYILAPDWL
jgi:hypothetical protein